MSSLLGTEVFTYTHRFRQDGYAEVKHFVPVGEDSINESNKVNIEEKRDLAEFKKMTGIPDEMLMLHLISHFLKGVDLNQVSFRNPQKYSQQMIDLFEGPIEIYLPDQHKVVGLIAAFLLKVNGISPHKIIAHGSTSEDITNKVIKPKLEMVVRLYQEQLQKAGVTTEFPWVVPFLEQLNKREQDE